MSDLTLRRAMPGELEPLERLLSDPEALAIANPSAKQPFDPFEWHETWLGDPGDAAFYVLDSDGAEIGFFALRPGIGPEQRHLTYLYLDPAHRGGAGQRMTELVEDAARGLDALTITLKVETDNAPARAAYLGAGYEETGVSGGMATMRRDLG